MINSLKKLLSDKSPPPLDSGLITSRIFHSGREGPLILPIPKIGGKQVLFQDYNARYRVESDGDPVSLALDLSNGLELEGDYVAPIGTWGLTNAPAATVEGEYINWSSSDSSEYITNISAGVAANVLYEVSVEVTRHVEGDIDVRFLSGALSAVKITGIGNYTTVVRAGAGSLNAISDNGVADLTFRIASIRKITGNHVSQEDVDKRATYHTDGVRHWLRFDGVDDELVSENTIPNNYNISVASGFSFQSIGGSATISLAGYHTGASYSALAVRSEIGRVAMQTRFTGSDVVSPLISGFSQGDKVTAIGRQNSSLVEVRASFNDVFQGAETLPQTAAATGDQISFKLGNNFGHVHDIYAAVGVTDYLTDDETSLLFKFVSDLMGI